MTKTKAKKTAKKAATKKATKKAESEPTTDEADELEELIGWIRGRTRRPPA